MDSPSCNRISAMLRPSPNHRDPGRSSATLSYRQFACHRASIPAKPGKYEVLANVIAGSGLLLTRQIRMALPALQRLAQFSHLVHAARNSLLLLPLIPSLCLVPSSLLPRFFGAL